VTVSPGNTSLLGGSQQAFTATVTGSANQNVTWSISPGMGSMNGNVYTAPASVSSLQNVTVTATSVADGVTTGSATVQLVPPSSLTSVRFNIGGPLYTDPLGQLWKSDTTYPSVITSASIANTTTPALYQSASWNWGSMQYQYQVLVNGNYT